jgi:capsular polysaccharide biosynthesis protein
VLSQAEVVLGPHGAGLSSIIACERNATLIEFAVRPYYNPAYAHLAATMGMAYRLDTKVKKCDFV